MPGGIWKIVFKIVYFSTALKKSNKNETERTKVQQKTSSYKLHLKSLRLLAIVFS
jgi:hypothetical protein